MRSFVLLRRFLFPAVLLLFVVQAHAGLVLHYAFDESSGTTAADSSGNSNTGTLTNMTGSEWTTGKIGGALAFDGVDDYVLTSAAGPTGTSARTVAMWFKTSVSDRSMLQYGGGTYGGNFRMRLDGGILSFDPSHANKKLLSPSVADGAWHHWAITWAGGGNRMDDSTMTFFLDGTEYADGTYNTSGSTSTDGTFSVFRAYYTISTSTNHATTVIGAAQTPENVSNVFEYWQGAIDDVRIYNTVLTASEVSALAGGGGSAAPEPAETFAFLSLLTTAGLGLREWRSRRKAKAV